MLLIVYFSKYYVKWITALNRANKFVLFVKVVVSPFGPLNWIWMGSLDRGIPTHPPSHPPKVVLWRPWAAVIAYQRVIRLLVCSLFLKKLRYSISCNVIKEMILRSQKLVELKVKNLYVKLKWLEKLQKTKILKINNSLLS